MFELRNSDEIYEPTDDEKLLLQEYDLLEKKWDIYGKSNYNFHTGDTLKNRYQDVLPYEDNRVTIRQGSYINASPIDIYGRKMIACQAPLKSTMDDFFYMIFEQNCSEIICLTETNINKMDSYLEHKSNNFSCEYKIIKHKNNIFSPSKSIIYTVIDLTITQKNGDKRTIKFYQYFDWKDMGVSNAKNVIDFYKTIIENRKEGKTIVHCSAGIGRTGTYLAIEQILNSLDTVNSSKEKMETDELIIVGVYISPDDKMAESKGSGIQLYGIHNGNKVDIIKDNLKPKGNEKSQLYKIVDNLRQQRYGMVQGEYQYAFIYHVIETYVKYY